MSAPSSGLCVDWLLVLFHLVGLLAFAGRLHLQAGAVSGRPPPGYRSGGGRSGLPAGKKASAAPHYQRVFFSVQSPSAPVCLCQMFSSVYMMSGGSVKPIKCSFVAGFLALTLVFCVVAH